MTTIDDFESDEHPMLKRLIKLGLVLLAQGIAVMLIGIVALLVSLFVSLDPAWSATSEQAK